MRAKGKGSGKVKGDKVKVKVPTRRVVERMPAKAFGYGYQNEVGARSQVWKAVNRTALGKAVGLSRSQISRVLSGKGVASYPAMRAIANALGMGVDELEAKVGQENQKFVK